MISYKRLWKTMKERGITQYDLYEHYNIPRSLLHRLRNDMNTEVFTLDKLCSILNCRIEDIVEYIPSETADLNFNKETTDSPTDLNFDIKE